MPKSRARDVQPKTRDYYMNDMLDLERGIRYQRTLRTFFSFR